MSKKILSVNTTKLNLEVVNHIWRLTKSKKLKWKRNNVLGYHHANYENIKVQIEFYNFQRMDDTGSDATVGEINVEILDSENKDCLIFEYSIGTEGFDLLKKIIHFSKKSWRRSSKRFQKRKISMIDYLSKLK